MSLRTLLALAATAAVLTGGAVTAAPAPAPVKGQVFEPAPQSTPLYGTQEPSEDPDRQRAVVEAADGVDLYVETWLPAPEAGRTPPAKIPTILIMTPYVKQGARRYREPRGDAIEYFTARGYAVAQAHVRGTGESGGCLEQTASNQIDDGARVIEYLGRDAPWSNGNVGMYGISYDAETQISVAGLGDKTRTRYLKAIVPAATVAGQYEYSHADGVPFAGQALLSNAAYLGLTSAIPGETSGPVQYAEKTTCQPEVMANSLNPTGDVGPYWMAREYRGGASTITAATLQVHGLADFNVQPSALAGFFDRLPASTPHKGLFGVWDHNFSNAHNNVAPDWARADWFPMVTAWYDRYLKGLKTGVEKWPPVQVQASDGSWRVERDFPGTGGPVGHLALGPTGTLGLAQPDPVAGTSFLEGVAGTPLDGTASFTTPALTKPLHLTGQPVLDLWLTTDRPDGHLAAQVTVLGPDGEPLVHEGSSAETHATYGFRSLQHLEPIRENWFRQSAPVLPEVGEPLRVQVRFLPTDLVVPVGGRLQVEVAGALDSPRLSMPSGTGATITLLHDCEHLSALRFLMADPKAPALEVREVDQEGRLKAPAPKRRVVDGDLASDKVCGRAPERLDAFRPTRDLVARK
jgi:X-Pro dipeptidyl-peptidase